MQVDRKYVRYGLASVVALGGDVALFLILLAVGFSAALSASFGYVVGIVIHWLISSRLVFAEGAARSSSARKRQKALFLGSALIGLALTTAIVAFGRMAGLMPPVAKAIAIGVSFQVTYLLRKLIVFA